MASEPAPGWHGWHGWQRLPGQRWLRVVEAATEDACRERLFAHPFPGPTRDVTVLPAGADPNRPRRRF